MNRGNQSIRSPRNPVRLKAAPACTTNHLPHQPTKTGEAAGERHRPIRARGTIRARSQRRPPKSTGSQPSSKTACRLRSPRTPLSRITRPHARGRTKPPNRDFHAPKLSCLPAQMSFPVAAGFVETQHSVDCAATLDPRSPAGADPKVFHPPCEQHFRAPPIGRTNAAAPRFIPPCIPPGRRLQL
jgi:hypothetical protein